MASACCYGEHSLPLQRAATLVKFLVAFILQVLQKICGVGGHHWSSWPSALAKAVGRQQVKRLHQPTRWWNWLKPSPRMPGVFSCITVLFCGGQEGHASSKDGSWVQQKSSLHMTSKLVLQLRLSKMNDWKNKWITDKLRNTANTQSFQYGTVLILFFYLPEQVFLSRPSSQNSFRSKECLSIHSTSWQWMFHIVREAIH